MAQEAKEYEITTLEQLVNIANEENVERLSIDFLLWLRHTIIIFDEIKKKNPELKDSLNSEIAEVKFIWVDDNKHELLSTEIINKTTGDIKKIKHEK